MSRNKMRKGNAYPPMAGTNVDGGGKVNMGAGAGIKPRESEDGGINAKAQLAAQAGAAQPTDDSSQLMADSTMPEDKSGESIMSVGESAGSVINERQKRQAADKKKSSGGGRGYGA